jgi:hypothetical protein
MVNWEFRDPLFLLFAFFAPLVYLLASRSGSVVRYSSLAITDRAPRSVRLRLAKLPAFLLAVAVVSLPSHLRDRAHQTQKHASVEKESQ